jgi:Domain of unknown function (DUF4440)
MALVVFAAAAAVLTVAPQATSWADSCSDALQNSPLALDERPCADVLAQERRWLTAITDGDRATVESILAPSFKHINFDAELLDRELEIGECRKGVIHDPSEQLVDLSGDTAVIHGVNTLIDDGKVLALERFTDVFQLQDGRWLALSAQETTL